MSVKRVITMLPLLLNSALLMIFLGQAFSSLNCGQSWRLLLDVNMKLYHSAGEMVLLAFDQRGFTGWLLSMFIKRFHKKLFIIHYNVHFNVSSPKLLSLLSEAHKAYALWLKL